MSHLSFVHLRLAGAAIALLAAGATVLEGSRAARGSVDPLQLALEVILFVVCVPWSRDERRPPTFKHPLPPLP